MLDLGEGPTTSRSKESLKEEKEPPRNNVVKSASAPAKSIFAGADAQNPRRMRISDSSVIVSETNIGTSQSVANSNQDKGLTPQPEGQPDAERRILAPDGAPRTRVPPPDQTTEGVGGRLSGTSAADTRVAADQSLTKAQIGNQGCGASGAGSAAMTPGGYHATIDQCPVVPPPASQCDSATEREDQLGG